MKKPCLAAGLCLALALPSAAWAQATTLTFDEVPPYPGTLNPPVPSIPTPVTNPAAAAGLSPFLSFNGVTFQFRVDGALSADARYNARGPGDFNFIQGQVLEGDAGGVLTLTFDLPTPVLGFGLALSSPSNLTPGFTVNVYEDPGSSSIGAIPVNTQNLAGTTEARFSYVGAPIRQAVIDFNEGPLPTFPRRFAMDNLTFTPIPEPATVALFSTGLLGLAAGARRRGKARRDAP
jgi:hypothetical protein